MLILFLYSNVNAILYTYSSSGTVNAIHIDSA